MHISYVDFSGRRQTCAQSGFNVKIFLPASSRDVEVSFSVVGGNRVYKVDRSDRAAPWVRDASGHCMPETFVYTSDSMPQHVQYFVRGSSLHSWVAQVDERQRSESLLHLISRDYNCVRSLNVAYTDLDGGRQQWSGSGYNVTCHLPSDARDVEVTFSVVGGRKVCKVDRREPAMPWVEDLDGHRLPEKFFYAKCPPCAQYDIRGPSLHAFISHVFEQQDLAAASSGSTMGSMPSTGSGIADGRGDFGVAAEMVPAIGGGVELQAPHSEFLLPKEVALFEPGPAQLFFGGVDAEGKPKGPRQIFLNTPLSDTETAALAELHRTLAKRGIGGEMGDFPRYMELHALRILQTCKWNVNKSVELMKTMVKERVRRLPMAEAEVLPDLKKGFFYFHGRDRFCRPCFVIRLERLIPMASNKERIVRCVIFTLEYALRYVMVPGRVENWVVLVDFANILSAVSPLQTGSLASAAAALGTALEKVYCGRMSWLKILNMPSFIGRAVNSVIPAEKKEKISFPTDIAAELAPHFEPNQLEQKYGGTAPDLEPHETYPFRFFPNCRGLEEEAVPPSGGGGGGGSSAAEDGAGKELSSFGLRRSHSTLRDPEAFSLHESTSRAFHEGFLWDTSSETSRAKWLEAAREQSLTPEAARWLGKELGEGIEPCRDLEMWLELINPVARRHSSQWLEEETTPSACSPGGGDEFLSNEQQDEEASTPSASTAGSVRRLISI